MLKRFATLVALTFLASAAFAQHEHHEMTDDDYRAIVAALSSHGPVIPQPPFSVVPTATQSFTITATAVTSSSGYSFTVSPTPFTVNQGDTVNITFTVPSSDKSTAGTHGLLMDTYFDGFTSGSQQPFNVSRGSSASRSFVATTAGNFSFVCNVPSCGSGHSNMFGSLTVNPSTNPAPTISGLNPGSGPTTGGTTVTISGTNFGNGAAVTFGGTSGTNVNVVSSTSITVVTPAHAVGTAAVTVMNADGKSATLTSGFQYNLPAPTITVTSFNPTTGPTSGNTLVTITGTNFQSGAAVTFGNAPAVRVTVVSSTTITALTPLGPATQQVAVPVSVTVTNPDSTTATLGGFQYTVPPLAVLSLEPPAGPLAGGNVVTLIGAGFTSALASTVKFGGVSATNVQVISAVTMKVTVPSHAAGAVDVALTVGTTTSTATNAYVYGNAPSKRRAVAH